MGLFCRGGLRRHALTPWVLHSALQAAFKVVDHALVDGVTALYRVALRTLKANEEDLLQAANGTGEQDLSERVWNRAHYVLPPPSGQEFMVRLRAIAQRYIEQDVDDAFLFSVRLPLNAEPIFFLILTQTLVWSQKTQLFAELTPAQVLLAETKAQEANPQLDSLEDPSLSTSSLPTVKESSLVLSQEQFEVIWQWLPSRYRVKNPVRHFSSSKDGFSILSIYRKCQKSAPHLFIVKTKQGKVPTSATICPRRASFASFRSRTHAHAPPHTHTHTHVCADLRGLPH